MRSKGWTISDGKQDLNSSDVLKHQDPCASCWPEMDPKFTCPNLRGLHVHVFSWTATTIVPKKASLLAEKVGTHNERWHSIGPLSFSQCSEIQLQARTTMGWKQERHRSETDVKLVITVRGGGQQLLSRGTPIIHGKFPFSQMDTRQGKEHWR